MKVDGSLKSLLQGVSQQPPRDRLSGQSTAQINMSADPVTGLTRRPPTDLVGTLGTSSSSKGWIDFETQNGNKYVAWFHDGTLSVKNTNAQAQTLVIDANAAAYLTGNGPWVGTTQENEIVIANTSRTAAMSTALSAYANKGTGSKPQGIIQVLGGAYGRKYSISKDGVEICYYKTPNGSTAWNSQCITTTFIAQVLEYLLKNNATGAGAANPVNGNPLTADAVEFSGTAPLTGANWTVVRKDDIIYIINNAATDFLLTVSDDQGNVNMKAMNETVPDVSDLPRIAPQGYIARVATETDPDEDLFLEFIVDGTPPATGLGFGKPGYWQECVASGIKYQLDASTMPHVLVYDQVADSFRFRRQTWKDRAVGSLVSNPDPSFIGNTINDVSTFQGRLVFLAGPNTIMTRTNKQTDFWMGSASAIVDSDPIDISSNSVQTSRMVYAIPHNRDLVIFAERGQFIIFGRTSLTPANAAMVLTTAFEASLVARPAPSGRNVFFAMTYGRFAGIREFYTEGGTDINDTRPITQHLKKYIEGTVQRLATASNYDLLLTTTDANKTVMYPYQYIWSDTEKVQSAWSTWQFAHEIEYTFFDRDVFYTVVKDGTAFNLFRMPLDVEDSAGMEFPVYLDARFDVFGCNTQFSLPGSWLADEDLEIAQSTDCPNPGMRVGIKSVVFNSGLGQWVVTLDQDMLGGDIIGGIKTSSKYVPTMPIVKDQDGVAVGTGTLVISNFIVSIENTGDINGRAYSKWDDGEVVKFQGRVVGESGNIVGVPALDSGKFQLPFRSKADEGEVEFFTDSFYPMTLLDIEWVGQYTKRGKRLKTGA